MTVHLAKVLICICNEMTICFDCMSQLHWVFIDFLHKDILFHLDRFITIFQIAFVTHSNCLWETTDSTFRRLCNIYTLNSTNSFSLFQHLSSTTFLLSATSTLEGRVTSCLRSGGSPSGLRGSSVPAASKASPTTLASSGSASRRPCR